MITNPMQLRAPLISIIILTLSALSSLSLASPLPHPFQPTPSYHPILRRALPPDVTTNILFSLIGLLLAAITIVQAAFLARTHFRRSQAQDNNPSVDMDMDMNAVSVNASSHNDDSSTTNTNTTASVSEDTPAATSPSHPSARQTTSTPTIPVPTL